MLESSNAGWLAVTSCSNESMDRNDAYSENSSGNDASCLSKNETKIVTHEPLPDTINAEVVYAKCAE